jgi:hypothetical protein
MQFVKFDGTYQASFVRSENLQYVFVPFIKTSMRIRIDLWIIQASNYSPRFLGLQIKRGVEDRR